MAGTDLGLPYWDWSEDPRIPSLWEGIISPLKDWTTAQRDYTFNFKRQMQSEWTSICENVGQDPGSHAMRIKNKNVLQNLGQNLKSKVSTALEDSNFARYSKVFITNTVLLNILALIFPKHLF